MYVRLNSETMRNWLCVWATKSQNVCCKVEVTILVNPSERPDSFEDINFSYLRFLPIAKPGETLCEIVCQPTDA